MSDVPDGEYDAAAAVDLARIASDLWRRVASQSAPTIVIDGLSGTGKSTLATAVLRDAERDAPRVQLLQLDAFYPGWSGLDAASKAVEFGLAALSRGRVWQLREWDWRHSRPGVVRAIEPHTPLIIEGCGALTAETTRRSSLAVVVEYEEAARRERALARDGDGYRLEWNRWLVQDLRHRDRLHTSNADRQAIRVWGGPWRLTEARRAGANRNRPRRLPQGW